MTSALAKPLDARQKLRIFQDPRLFTVKVQSPSITDIQCWLDQASYVERWNYVFLLHERSNLRVSCPRSFNQESTSPLGELATYSVSFFISLLLQSVGDTQSCSTRKSLPRNLAPYSYISHLVLLNLHSLLLSQEPLCYGPFIVNNEKL